MPRGKKSKARAREKRRQTQDEPQKPNDAQAKAVEKGESSGDAGPSTSVACFPQGKEPTATAGTGLGQEMSVKGTKGQEEENGSPSRAPLSTGAKQMDLLSRKTGMLVEYMLCKYKIKQPAKRGEMLKVINKRFKEHFPEMLKKAAYRLDMVYGIEMKEDRPHGQSYVLVSKLDFRDDGSGSNTLGVPNRGILIPLLSVIYINGYCAPEEEVWRFLNMLGINDGVPHLIFGDVRKLITEDLVEEKYLEYRQVPGTDPVCYQFLWGPRAYCECSKKRVTDFLDKISKTVPSVHSSYEQALIEEEEKAKAEAAVKPGSKGKAKGRSKSKFSNATH
ncbi:melanoma-associated antigen B4-like [Meriones unguiculatus]|uniref:melanoma-associated antigen B4-like n=1 Tax=Meriones unguiculatus TaxID=10047 RepID=UPI00293E5498|nr:melanoma-associated antigen B4-like [Meriones unguiculatus]